MTRSARDHGQGLEATGLVGRVRGVTGTAPTDALSGLNPAQREAVEAPDGPVLVIAGAGSGKTRVLTHRIAHLLATGRARPGEILAITFTNRAAAEMRERVIGQVGAVARAMWVTTFHSACARILRGDAERLGYSRSFTIYDESDSLRVIKRCMEEEGVDPKRFPPKAIRAQISAAKNNLVDAEDYAALQGSYFESVTAGVYRLYERRMLEANAMDFDDLLVRMVNLLELNSDLLARWQRSFQHILVDEYQDTNRAQYRLLQLLSERHRNLFVVGDEDQSIYAFRQADIRNILDFEKDFPEARLIKLEQNYRSTQNILSAANAVVANNRERREKKLWTDSGDGAKIKVAELGDEHEEARWVAAEIDRLYDEESIRPSEVAVFYRTNAMSRVLEDVLTREGTQYQVIGGTRFYDRAEIKDAIAYLSFLHNPANTVAFSRIINTPRRGIGDTSQGRLLAHANTTGQPIGEILERPEAVPGLGGAAVKAVGRFAELISELRQTVEAGDPLARVVEQVLNGSGYIDALEAERTIEAEGRLENLRELVNVASEFDAERQIEGESEIPPLDEFLQQVSLYSQQDELEGDNEKITLMTLHNAKGLEYQAVFMIGCEDGVFPHLRSLEEGQEEEERRLCYVGMTRARKHLALSWARERSVFGGRYERGLRSRFLGEIPPELIDEVSTARRGRWGGGTFAPSSSSWDSGRVAFIDRSAPARGPVRRRDPGLAPALQIGDDVEHASFGEGVVTGVENGGVVVVRFAGDGSERKLMADYAPLKKRAA